jgi:serine protease Do
LPSNRASVRSAKSPKSDEIPAAFKKTVPSSMDDLRAMERHVEALVAKVSPAVVSVRVNQSIGSAVVITEEGFVLSAAHVCGEPDMPVVFTFPSGRTARGKTLGTDHGMDSGLMKITDPGPWPHVEMAEPTSVRPGDWVLALGHPGGFDHERSVVARLGRVIRLGDLLQTDCTLIGGDSGGPLFDMRGAVVGIHSRISDSTTENFHVPIGTFVATWDRLAKGENWGEQATPTGRWTTIGVRAIDAGGGCRLESVSEDGPGYRAGLLAGDLIVQIEDEPVTNADCLSHYVRQANPGDEITLVVRRDGQDVPIKVKVEARRRWGRGWRGGQGP